MVELGVREHRDPRRQPQQRAVGLVGLDDVLPACRRWTRSSTRHRRPGTTGPGRSRGARARACSRSSSCRGCGHGDVGRSRVSSPSSSARCSSRSPRSRAAARSGLSGRIGWRRRLQPRPGRWRRRARPPARCRRTQLRGVGRARRAVRAGDSRAERAGDQREPAHAGPADAHEVQPPAGPFAAHGEQARSAAGSPEVAAGVGHVAAEAVAVVRAVAGGRARRRAGQRELRAVRGAPGPRRCPRCR